jgi:hypothetical protein
MKGFVHHLSHACRQAILRYAVFLREIHPQIFIFIDVTSDIGPMIGRVTGVPLLFQNQVSFLFAAISI